MEVGQVIGLSIATYIVMNIVGKVILEYTKNYKDTETKLDDHTHRFFKTILKALKFINDTTLNRY